MELAAIDSPPVITSISYPDSLTAADPAGGETITVTGSNFQTGATVTVGGTSASSVTVVSTSSITFVAPAKTAGDYDLVVTNANGLFPTLSSGFSYNGTPSFTTAAGNIGTLESGVAMSTITIVATEPDGGTLAFSVTVDSITFWCFFTFCKWTTYWYACICICKYNFYLYYHCNR